METQAISAVALPLPPGIKSPEGVNAILGFLGGALKDLRNLGNQKPIRFHDDKDGKRWWQLSDVCEALDIKNPSDAKKRLPKAFLTTIDSTEGGPARTFVDISGVSQFILESRKPEAQPYKGFINGAVVPELCATGSYEGKAPEELVQVPAIAEAMTAVALGPTPGPEPLPGLALIQAIGPSLKAAKAAASALGLKGQARILWAAKAAQEALGFDMQLEAVAAVGASTPEADKPAPPAKIRPIRSLPPGELPGLQELGERLGAKPGTLKNRVYLLGVPFQKGVRGRLHFPPEAQDILLKAHPLFEQGWTAAQVKAHLGLGGQPVPHASAPPRVGPENHITPSELGGHLNPRRSAQDVNRALENLGFIERYYPNTPAKAHEWRLTPLGAQFGGAVFPVDKAHNSGVTEQIRWAAGKILPQLTLAMKEAK